MRWAFRFLDVDECSASIPVCASMPIVRILAALIVVPVRLDLPETEKRAAVRE